MDPISILNGVKNKVLDATNYDLLKRTYNLQNENIEQLKTSNNVFKESNERLQEEVNGLKMENESLKQTVAELTQRVSQLNGGSVSSGLSDVAFAILDLYHRLDKAELFKETEIIPALKFSTIQIESAIDELKTAKMIEWSRISNEESEDWDSVSITKTAYSLTVEGKKYVAENI